MRLVSRTRRYTDTKNYLIRGKVVVTYYMSTAFSESCDLASVSFPRSTLMRNSTNLLYTSVFLSLSLSNYVYAGKDRVGCRQPHLTPHYKVQSWQIVQTLQLYYDRLRFPFYYLKQNKMITNWRFLWIFYWELIMMSHLCLLVAKNL